MDNADNMSEGFQREEEMAIQWREQAWRITDDAFDDDPIGSLFYEMEAWSFAKKYEEKAREAFILRRWVLLQDVIDAAKQALCDRIYDEFAAGKRKPIW